MAHNQGIWGLANLEKISSVAFLEVKLLAEKPRKGWKIEYFPKVGGLLIKKHGNISIICFVYSQKLHYWLVVESFLVCEEKIGGVLGPKTAPV